VDLFWKQLLTGTARDKLEAHLTKVQEQLDLTWLDRDLLGEALTTTAYLAEDCRHPFRHQQWLEFLGDGVLRTIVRAYFMKRLSCEVSQLARLCDEHTDNKKLSEIGARIGLDTCTFPVTKNKPPPLADTYEALVGACFMDGGYEEAEKFVRRTFLDVDYPTTA